MEREDSVAQPDSTDTLNKDKATRLVDFISFHFPERIRIKIITLNLISTQIIARMDYYKIKAGRLWHRRLPQGNYKNKRKHSIILICHSHKL